MENSAEFDRLSQYPKAAVKYAQTKLMASGWTPLLCSDFGEYWDAVEKYAKEYQSLTRPALRRSRTPAGTDARTPAIRPQEPPEAPDDVFSQLASVGTLRGFHMATGAGGGFAVTLKVTLHSGAKVYRYGHIRELSEWRDLVQRWIDKGYWTPDKQ